jgi:hypothetical protein
MSPPEAAAAASTSMVPENAGSTAPAPPLPFPSQASRGVRSQPRLDSEAMVDAALTNMLHDIDELPPLPPLSDFVAAAAAAVGGPTTHAHAHAHSHSHAAPASRVHPALDIFDSF